MAALIENAISIMNPSGTTVALDATGATTLYTVPAGKVFIPIMVVMRISGDPVDCTCTIGSTGTTATSFLNTQTFHTNVDATGEVAIFQPIPAASTAASMSYAAADVFQITIGSGGAAGGVTGKTFVLGLLY